jgi:hypothetical protein
MYKPDPISSYHMAVISGISQSIQQFCIVRTNNQNIMYFDATLLLLYILLHVLYF